jgi:hypothetical protein
MSLNTIIIDIPAEVQVVKEFSRVCLWFESPETALTFALLMSTAKANGATITIQFEKGN